MRPDIPPSWNVSPLFPISASAVGSDVAVNSLRSSSPACEATTLVPPRFHGQSCEEGLQGRGSGSGTWPSSAMPALTLGTQLIDLMCSNMDSRRRLPTKDGVLSRRYSFSTHVCVDLDTMVAGRTAGVKPIVPTTAHSWVGCVALAPFPALLIDFATFNVWHAEAEACNEARIGRLMYDPRIKYSGVGESFDAEGVPME